MAKKNRVIKTTKFVVPANNGKFEQVKAMLKPFQTTLSDSMMIVDKDFQQNGEVSKYTWLKPADLNSELSARQFKTAYTQAVEAYLSYTAILEDKFRILVAKSKLDHETKHRLYVLNKLQGWYRKEMILTWIEKEEKDEDKDKDKKKGEYEDDKILVNPKLIDEDVETFEAPMPQNILKLARKILKRCRKWISRPDLRNVQTLKLNANLAIREDAKTSSHFKYWLRLSTLERLKLVYLPLKNNPYFDKLRESEKELKSYQLTIHKDYLVIGLITESKRVKPRKTGRSLGLDFGMKHLFTTSDGRMFGSKMLQQLRIWDEMLTEHDAALQAAGIARKDDPEHVRLNDKIRNYAKNEIGRILNSLADEDIRELVVEDLQFSGSGLSKRLNRLLTRTGRAAIKNKYERLKDLNGITVTKVEPAFTSQTCSSCGYTSKSNRKSQNSFICGCCGLKINADVNAAKNIRARRSRSSFRAYSSKQRQKFLEQMHAKHSIHCASCRQDMLHVFVLAKIKL